MATGVIVVCWYLQINVLWATEGFCVAVPQMAARAKIESSPIQYL